jgi:alpha-D-ribose 1-methylphosphonate 5-phosphate C-P lyase
VPYPDPLALIEPNEKRRRSMHADADYSRLYVKLYEDLVRLGEISVSHRFPTLVHGRYIIDPSPIPRFDLPKLHYSPALVLFAAGREKKVYAVPPYTAAKPLEFDDVPFRVEAQTGSDGSRLACGECGSQSSFLEQSKSRGAWRFQCSDTDYCDQRRRGSAE